MSNDITELRGILFDTLRGLKDGTVKVDQAKMINETAGVLVQTARAETEMLELIGGQGSGFIPRVTTGKTIEHQPVRLPGLADQAGAAGKAKAV